MAKLPAMQNQYVEFAKNDSNGKKIDIEALNSAIEAVKNGSVPFYNSLDEVPTEEGKIPSIFGLSADGDEVDNYICFHINTLTFVSFQMIDDGGIYSDRYVYDIESEHWTITSIYNADVIPTSTGTKLYKHISPVAQSSGVEIISTVSTPFDLATACTGNHLFFNIGISGTSYKVISTYFDYPNHVYKLYYINSSGALEHYDVSTSSGYTDTVTPL